MTLKDSHGRNITYLRLSVTDRCQFRCLYCMPPEGIPLLPQDEYLTPDEMERLIRAAAELGVWRLRLTGGEPLLRKDSLSLVARFSTIPGIRDLAMTTNGERLPDVVSDLKRLGLQRVNISLDSLDPKRFHDITLSKSFHKVWDGIQLAVEAGLQVKINAVAMKGLSDEEIDRFAELAFQHPLEVRFIEFMPLCGSGWKSELFLPIEAVRSRIAAKFKMRPLSRGSEVAESYEMAGGKGRVGFIASLTEPFCGTCSRIRMSATGRIKLCLFSNLEYNIRPSLRRGASIDELKEEIRKAVFLKPKGHTFNKESLREEKSDNSMIRSIGG